MELFIGLIFVILFLFVLVQRIKEYKHDKYKDIKNSHDISF